MIDPFVLATSREDALSLGFIDSIANTYFASMPTAQAHNRALASRERVQRAETNRVASFAPAGGNAVPVGRPIPEMLVSRRRARARNLRETARNVR